MKKILTSFFLTLTASWSYSQSCQVTASASTQYVCEGTQVVISAVATAAFAANQFFNFNQGAVPQGWTTTGGTNYNSNTCGQAPDGTPYFWASTVTSGLPQIVTADFDVCSGGYLEFQMKYAVQGGSSPCEGPDEMDEGVSIEYSLNGGATWVEFIYYMPDGQILTANPGGNTSVASGNTPFTSWATYNVPIPAAAISSSTRFRWIQKQSSGSCCDNWGLDNIGIYAGPCLTTNLEWSNGLSGVSDFTYTPTVDSCFTATLYDDQGNYLCEDVVCIEVVPNWNTTLDVNICDGDTYYFGPTGSTLVPYTSTGSYPVSFSSVYGCDSTVTLNLTVFPISFDTTVTIMCDGDSVIFAGNTYYTAGIYPSVFQNAAGCDSTVVLDLSTYPVYATQKDTAICDGYTYTFGGQNFTTGGSFPLVFQTVNGCDSLVTLNITLLPAPVPFAGVDLTLCSNEIGYLGAAGVPNTSYSWSGPAGLSNEWIANPTVSANTTVPLQNTYIIQSDYQGCIGWDTVEVEIIPYPALNISPVAAQCLDGNSYNFTAGNSFLPTTVFNWNFPQANPTASYDPNPVSIHFTADGTFQVSLAANNGHCFSYDTLDVIVYAEPQASASVYPPNGCIPLSVNFTNNSIPSTVSSVWNLGNGVISSNSSPSTVYGTAGDYDVSLVVTTAEGCIDSVFYPTMVTAYPLPIAGFSANPQEAFQGDFITVNDNSQGTTIWDYSISSGGYYNTPGFNHDFADTGYHYIYQVVTNQYGCVADTMMVVHVSPVTTIYIPNAFTPNNDGINTTFGAYGNTIRNFHMVIYDRWGMKLFESRDLFHQWDGKVNGKLIKNDVYVYKVTYLDHLGNLKELFGNVTLIR